MTVLDISWVPVLIGAALAFMAGYVWYAPSVFGHRWLTAVGLPDNGKANVPALVVQAFSTLLLAWLLAVFYHLRIVEDIYGGIGLLFVVGALSGIFAAGLFQRRHMQAVMIDAGYYLVTVVVIVATLAIARNYF